MITTNTPNQSKTDRVFQCIKEMHANGKVAHRHTIASVLGLKLQNVDDHIKLLVGDELVRRTALGCVEPVKQFRKDEPMSMSYLQDGDVLLEKGDKVIPFTPSEWRKLGNMAIGASLMFNMAVKG